MNLRTSNIDKLRLGRSGEEMPRTRTVCIGCIMIVGEVGIRTCRLHGQSTGYAGYELSQGMMPKARNDLARTLKRQKM